MTLTRTVNLFLVALCATILTVLLNGLLQKRQISQKKSYNREIKGAPTLKDLQDLGAHVEVADALATLIYDDGAGSWPPRLNHDEWPSALSPYKHVYLELVHHLPTANPSLDDNTNNRRRHNFRSLMRKALTERVQMDAVEAIMQTAELEH
ncbi:hypothetical protein BKA63DRAFT_584078 [Paraphoma chrysanthemicola]|nr:hypothetical protein BKA63DRAFT_584078 [Paraphoma chrysanthemicola]